MPHRRSRYYRHLAMLFVGSCGASILAAVTSAYFVAKLQAHRMAALLAPPPPASMVVVVRMPAFWQRAYDEIKLNPADNRLRVLETYIHRAESDHRVEPLPVSSVPAFMDLFDSLLVRGRISEMLDPYLVTGMDDGAKDRSGPATGDRSLSRK